VVRVVSYGEEKTTPEAKTQKRGRNMAKGKPPEAPNDGGPTGEVERGVGTGVVIVDKGVILTNLHVVAGADKIKVTFYDGLEATATITGVQPENDLAVLQAQKIPDDLIAATMRSTATCARATRWPRSAFRSASARRCRRRGVGPEALVPLARGQAGNEAT
jgi:serine protease DegQ